MKSSIKLFLILLLFYGCTGEDDGMLCATGPVGFSFEILDKATGEDLFETGIYNSQQLKIKNQEGETVNFNFISNLNVFKVLLGWETKSDVYTVTIAEDIEFDIVFSLETSEEDCKNTRLKDLTIVGAEFETHPTSDLTTIFVNRENETN